MLEDKATGVDIWLSPFASGNLSLLFEIEHTISLFKKSHLKIKNNALLHALDRK